MEVESPGAYPFILAWTDAAQWQQDEMTRFDFRVTANNTFRMTPFKVDVASCVNDDGDLEGGTRVEYGGLNVIRDAWTEFTITGRGHGWLTIHSDISWDGTFTGPGGELFRDQGTLDTEQVYQGHYYDALPPGDYRFDIHELTGGIPVGCCGGGSAGVIMLDIHDP